MEQQNNNSATTYPINHEDGSKSIQLPSGAIAKIARGKGKHARVAMQVSGQDSSLYLNSLMAQLTTVNGASVVMEDLEEMDLQDYNAILAEFSGVNFTLPPGI